MEGQIVIVNGKSRKAFKKFGTMYVRCYYDVEVLAVDRFRKKCDTLGKTDTDIVRDLILEFNRSFGWQNDDPIRQAGSLYEEQSKLHVRDAVKQVIKKEFPWVFSSN